MAVYGYVGLCRAMLGYVGLCKAIERNVFHILANGEPLYDAYTTYLPQCTVEKTDRLHFKTGASLRLGPVIRTLRSDEGDGRGNVAKKVNSPSFSLHRHYSKSLTLSNVGEPSLS